MEKLPIVVGFGGINAAGRSSFHHMYNRLVIDKLDLDAAEKTYTDLAMHMGLVSYHNDSYIDQGGAGISPQQIASRFRHEINNSTLIRRIEKTHFDVEAVPFNKRATIAPSNGCELTFLVKKDKLPHQIPLAWRITPVGDDLLEVAIRDNIDVLLPQTRTLGVQSAGQLPSGFDPGKLYQSKHHPRALQMAIYAASDAIQSMGISWETVLEHVSADHISVYAGSLMGQMDDYGSRGMLSAWLKGEEVTSKQFSLGLVSMATDFVNSYVLGHIGTTSTHQGACATFLYNLDNAVQDIRSGRCRVAVVGGAEAPITPEIIESLRASGALAEDHQLIELDRHSGATTANHRRASRPFNYNCGFVCGESAQYVILFDDRLAMELGAKIYGAIPNVYVNADGFKKSITQPGIGNYITLAKAVNAARSIIGEKNIGTRSFVQAHGSSTPLNRITESHVLDSVAENFGIRHWPITAVKAYLGHSMATASGDQLVASLGVWDKGFIPGIFTLDKVAHDVHQKNLEFFKEHKEIDTEEVDAAFINSKGFGGNNATALMLSPYKTTMMLSKRYSKTEFNTYYAASEKVMEQANGYDKAVLEGRAKPIYHFGENIVDGEALSLSEDTITIPGYTHQIDITVASSYQDMI